MNVLEPDLSRVLVGTIDCALKGSEYATEGWQIIRRHLLLGKNIPLGTLERVIDLLGRAEDDVEESRSGITVDLSVGRVYEVNRPAEELGDEDT